MKNLKIENLVFIVLMALIPTESWAIGAASDGFFVKFNNQKALQQLRLTNIKSVESFAALETDLHYFHVAPGASTDTLMNELRNNPDVEYVVPNYYRHLGSAPGVQTTRVVAPFPIDKPASPTTWIKDPKGTTYAAWKSEAPKVWEKYTIGNPDIIIADIDTGVDYNHEDLASNIWHNTGEEGLDLAGKDKRTNGVDDDGNGFVDDFIGWNFSNNTNLPYDDHGHGTHTSGVAAGVGGNGKGLSGVCPRCSIMPIKFIAASGEGTDLDAIRSIEYAVKMGARVLNCSWGDSPESPALLEAMRATEDKGIMFVVAAGNDGNDIDLRPFFPARFNLSNQLTVAATYPVNIYIPFWSNYGRDKVHLSQIGVDVLSTVPDNGYVTMSGTSMATPGIAGAVGLIWSYRPGLTPLQLKALLKKNIFPDTDSMQKTSYGGRPNLLSLFKKL